MSGAMNRGAFQTPREEIHAMVARVCWRLGRIDPAEMFRTIGLKGRVRLSNEPRMRRSAVPAYQAAVLVLIQRHGMTTSRVGAFLGGRDHSTICDAHKKAQARMASDPVFAGVIRAELERAADAPGETVEELATRIAANAREDAARAAADAARVWWCGQCEARVTGARIAACAGRCRPEELPVALDDDFEGELAA